MTPATPAVLDRARLLVEPRLRDAVDVLVPELRQPARYHFGWTDEHGIDQPGGGGKGIRPALAVLSAEAVGSDPSVAVDGAAAVELVHNFSLVHDDIIDGDRERRHRRTVWTIWGEGDAIIVGDALHALAFEVLLGGNQRDDLDSGAIGSGATGDGEAGRVAATCDLAIATSRMIRGQSADMSFERRTDVTFDDCLGMEADKTGALLAFSASVGAVMSNADAAQIDALRRYGEALGLAFQAVDDILGIWGDPSVTGKAAGNDLRERKRSMPVTAALHSGSPEAARIAELYAAEVLSDDHIAELTHLVAAAGGRDRTELEASRQLEIAIDALQSAEFVDGPRRELAELAQFVVGRRH